MQRETRLTGPLCQNPIVLLSLLIMLSRLTRTLTDEVTNSSTIAPMIINATSCAGGRCDQPFRPSLPCHCDPGCLQYENCCEDFFKECGAQIVDTWVNFRGHSYHYFEDPTVSSQSASRSCREEGGLLLSINDQEEHEFIITGVLKKRTLTVFIGASSKKQEALWFWEDGSKVALPSDSWSEWYPGEPNNDEAVDSCSVLTNYKFWAIRKVSFVSYFWVDYGCDFNGQIVQGFICEKSLSCEPNPCENGGKCIYIGGDLGTDCQCSEGFIGDKCQGVAGNVWTMCGETILKDSSGTITSPGYPRSYPPLSRCNWTLSVNPESNITIRVTALVIENSKRCVYDSLTIYDGPNADSPVLLGPICSVQQVDLGQPIQTSSHIVFVTFHTDETIEHEGFNLKYAENKCGHGSGESGCGTARTLVGDCGEVEVKHGPQDGVSECRWSITSTEATTLNLTIGEFSIQDTGPQCENGGLTIYDGPSDRDVKIGTYCGRLFPLTLSSTNRHLTIVLHNVMWIEGQHVLKMSYEAKVGTPVNLINVIEGSSGRFSSLTSPIYFETDLHIEYMWRARVAVGDIMVLDWTIICGKNCSLKVYDGCCKQSQNMVDIELRPGLSKSRNHSEILTTRFQVLVHVLHDKDDADFLFDASFKSRVWEPVLSGCYWPHFSSATNDPTTENSFVTPQSPVIVMAARQSHEVNNPGYLPGLYCSWIVQTRAPYKLSLHPIGLDLPRLGTGCDADGFVVYDGATTKGTQYGPYCGSSAELSKIRINSQAERLKVVFYSDSMGRWRANGTFRAVVKTAGSTMCRFDEMSVPETVYLDASCGVMLSPRLPGDVMPGLWTWIIAQPVDHYFSVSVTYVRGPGLLGDCHTFFRLLEIARRSTFRRHWEADVLKVCQDEELHFVNEPILFPPNQKLGIELSTVATSFPQRWEFKLSYKTLPLQIRKDVSDKSPRCPAKHLYYRDHCYRYYHWFNRQTYPEDYFFLETWQAASEQCYAEGAYPLSIYDEDEAAFIKYALGRNNTYWFWDENGTFQTNHRLIFIGLHNRRGYYGWNNGIRMAYADWYKPPRKGRQPALHPDTKDAQLFQLSLGQPSPDQGSLCVVMMLTSPYGSLNWAKIPCDYPISRAGIICKRKADGEAESDTVRPASLPVPTLHEGYSACPEGWLMTEQHCLTMYTNYTKVRAAVEGKSQFEVEDMSRDEAELQCRKLGGDLASVSGDAVPEVIQSLLHLWRHDDLVGHIRLKSPGTQECPYILVLKGETSVALLDYQLMMSKCSDENLGIFSVLCEASFIEKVENCTGPNRFMCTDKSCIDVRFRCDNKMDCFDASDEIGCDDQVGMFNCDNGNKVSLNLFCDFIDNCGDNSDEKKCVLETCSSSTGFQCKSGQCIPQAKSCDFYKDCEDWTDEQLLECEGVCRGFPCFSGLCVQESLLEDLESDCPGLTQEDEIKYERGLETLEANTGREVESTLVNSTVIVGCDEGVDAQCRSNHKKCFPRDKTCIYDRKIMDSISGADVQASCRDGSHLRNSCGFLSCPGMFKCPGYYCIPYSRVCDGVIDCPQGHDENGHCQKFTCPGMLRCKGSTNCVTEKEICDGEVQCPQFKDDEEYCEEEDILCANCLCSGRILQCKGAGITDLPVPSSSKTRQLRAIFLSSNNITVMRDTFKGLHWLAVLDLSYNEMEALPDNAFEDLSNLRELYIHSNLLTLLKPEVFVGLLSLQKLDVSNNRLSVLRRETFSYITDIQNLILKGNILNDVAQDTFTELKKLMEIHTDAYKFCCIAKQVDICTPEPDAFSNCEDLMANYALQVSIWVLGTFAFVGNLFVVIWRVLTERSRVSSMFIINLGVADFLMGVYMLIIASVDVFYRGQYIVYADRWRASGLCQFVGILSMLSSEASVYMLCAITGDRLYALMFPLKASNFRMKHARIVVGFGWTLCAFLSLLPAVGLSYFGDAFFGRSGVCLPFHLSKERPPGWEYSVLVFLVINLMAFIFIFIGYVLIFNTVRESAKAVGEKSTANTNEYTLAKKLAIIVASDFACWVPIILIGFVALGGTDIPPQVAAWIAVFVLPLNSAINPVLYTMSNIQCGGKKKNIGMANRGNTASTGASRSIASAPTTPSGKSSDTV